MPEIITIFVLNLVFFIFATIAFILSLKISIKWDMDSTSILQYELEKKSFLASTIIKYIFSIKVPLFLFFIFALDKISSVLTGAMCAAGVVDAADFGMYLVILKILNIYLFAYWLKIDAQDMQDKNQPYTKQKFRFFTFLYLFLVVEIALESLMFYSIEIDKMVSCCGSIYSSSSSSAVSFLFSIDMRLVLVLFYVNFLLMILTYFLDKKYIFSLLNLVFIPASLLSLIMFFGTYIYELPSHHCPFCFLQKEYNYVGYILYALLFGGTFFGMVTSFAKESKSNYKISILFNSLYVILVSLFVVIYYIKNGVFL